MREVSWFEERITVMKEKYQALVEEENAEDEICEENDDEKGMDRAMDIQFEKAEIVKIIENLRKGIVA